MSFINIPTSGSLEEIEKYLIDKGVKPNRARRFATKIYPKNTELRELTESLENTSKTITVYDSRGGSGNLIYSRPGWDGIFEVYAGGGEYYELPNQKYERLAGKIKRLEGKIERLEIKIMKHIKK